MKVVIFGCGRTGANLSLQLSSLGHNVVVIDQSPFAFRRLGPDHTCTTVVGSGLDESILEKAGMKQAEAFFALTRGDNTNLMAGQVARHKYQIPKVCVKVSDPLRAEAYRRMGYFCINPSALTAGMMRDWLVGEPYKTVDKYNQLIKEMEL